MVGGVVGYLSEKLANVGVRDIERTLLGGDFVSKRTVFHGSDGLSV